MSGSNWRSNIAVGCGVVAGLLLALWFSTVVALGPAPGNILRGGEKQPAERNQTDPAPNRQPSPDKEKQKAATKEAECSNNGQNYHDCLIQLRTARATERQADVAKSTERVAWLALVFAALAAVAAWFTFWVMRKTAERQLRAYIFIENVNMADASLIPRIPATSFTPSDPFSASGIAAGAPATRPRGIPGASWNIRNFGQTPASKVAHWGKLDVLPISQEASLVPPPIHPKAARASIAPTGTSSKTEWFHRALSEQEISEIWAGTRAVYIYGRVEYKDAFKRDRVTTYRLRYTGAAYPPIAAPVFNYCEEGNDAT